MVRTKKAIKLSGMRDQLDKPLDEAAPANQSADHATSGRERPSAVNVSALASLPDFDVRGRLCFS
ncbi:hypothetical protein XI03_02450 [Bradyrhizobium sp. CCBAU 65884]|uniref:hypothetical protein n=1 Tax=Bradyrhizobium sp. CCBAU 65884 TaxID=722477 RepID=UPI002305400C|nr:hypothetical protein [Bradyrhizobium sp. CCBAU 65884]MDA9473394.1 hypothetical protein [Bradyrhizobium sp. CCBAU 65884]